jgi:aspartyl-tRNA(Asn)/glutamyl-tRNA(Gln) amidotransferase subunit A
MSLSNPFNAYITTLPESPAKGPRFAVKDLIATAGIRTTAGSRILADWVPARSAPVVRALEAAGWVMTGKTNTHEFAFGTTNDNPHYGPARNPWNPSLTTGGSSGGSAAAVAAGDVPMALGTDTAGSVRIPAALCGCVGFKPGWGVVAARGVIPLAPSLDTVGFLSATVADSAAAFAAVVGARSRPAARTSLKGLTIGVIESHAFDRVEDEIVASIEAALGLLEKRGARIRRIAGGLFADVMEVGVPLVRSEAWQYHRQWFPDRREEYGPDVARSLDAASKLTAADYRGAKRGRSVMERSARRLLGEVDLLAGPTVPVTAFPNRVAFEPVAPGGDMPRFALTRLTYPFSLSRLPAITVPSGLSSRRLPIGLQLAAGPGREAFLLGVAAAYESARGPMPAPPLFK